MLTPWLLSILLAQTLMVFAWLVYRYVGNPIIADIAWGINITFLALMHQYIHPGFHWSVALVLVWGLRLSIYLYWTRLRHHWHDKRYQILQEKSQHLFLNYQIQGILQSVIALPWFFIQTPIPVSIQLLASLVFGTGFVIECLADFELHRFKASSQGLCQQGLWAYSRHPNYLGEILIWIGFACFGMNTLWGWLGLCSPLGLYCIMRYITVPLTEKTSIHSKGQMYINYQNTTPMIFPKLRFHFWFNRT
jgi:steroid 5-alpha reductase family enzyme